MTFRKKINSLHLENINSANEIIDNIDKINKKKYKSNCFKFWREK